MGLTSPFDTDASTAEPAILGSRLNSVNISELPASQSTLRFGGLTMDSRTGVTHWRGHTLQLSLEERELLGVFLRHAGQILTTERFAALLKMELQQVDVRVSALVARLKQDSVTCLPCRASGLGYILWRC